MLVLIFMDISKWYGFTVVLCTDMIYQHQCLLWYVKDLLSLIILCSLILINCINAFLNAMFLFLSDMLKMPRKIQHIWPFHGFKFRSQGNDIVGASFLVCWVYFENTGLSSVILRIVSLVESKSGVSCPYSC